MFKILRRRRIIEDDEYLIRLAECASIAKEESKILAAKIVQLENILINSKNELESALNTLNRDPDFSDEALYEHSTKLTASIKDQIENGLKQIKNSHDSKRKNLEHFTVTLFGRTKAGKSTIREALTGGNGETIGKGGQRMTREVYRYFWNKLQIIDTPGIAAFEGDEDVTIAESVIDESDIIIFLVTSDSLQQSEFDKLAGLKAQNKPIIVLLNVKHDIENKLHRKRFLDNWEKYISNKAQKENIEHIRQLSRKYFNSEKIEIIPIHAMAAFVSVSCNNTLEGKLLYNASRIGIVKNRIREIVIREGLQKVSKWG